MKSNITRKPCLKNIPRGDASITGSAGAALTGGQKQRIALARAVCSKLQAVISGDILSGLDSITVVLIRDRLFGMNGHFRSAGRSVVFVTNFSDIQS